MTGYLTPDTIPASTTCRKLLIPDDRMIIAAVTGALQSLADSEAWTPFGSVTPDEIAEAIRDMMDEFSLNGECEVMPNPLPVGMVFAFAGQSVPDGALFCDGATYLIADYPELFDAIGNVWGGNGTTTFDVPDLRLQFVRGAQLSGVFGGGGGEATHVLTTSEIPSHNHPRNASGLSERVLDHNNSGTQAFATGGTRVVITDLQNTGNQGGGQAHNNLPPYYDLNYCIVAVP